MAALLSAHAACDSPRGIVAPAPQGAGQDSLRAGASDLLAAGPLVRVYERGSLWYLERVDGTDTSRVALESKWGASIVEASLNGVNLVNSYDTGREVQVSLYDGEQQYDGCAGCTGVFGWNPVQGGDRYSNGSPVLAHAFQAGVIYAKVQPYQWYPNDKGGSATRPVLSDVYLEQWLSVVPEQPRTFRVHVRITHFGGDTHAAARQEFPAVFVNREADRFVSYRGPAPWAGDSVTRVTTTTLAQTTANIRATEPWGTFMDPAGNGLTVFVPGDYGYFRPRMSSLPGSGPKGSGNNYFAPFAPFGLGPGEVYEGDYYLVVGDDVAGRRAVYALQGTADRGDHFSPWMNVEAPAAGAALAGTAAVSGWAFDNVAVAAVQVYLDDAPVGSGTYGLSRPDVPKVWAGVPNDTGWRYSLDTTRFANGAHRLTVKVTDTSGRSITRSRQVVIANP